MKKVVIIVIIILLIFSTSCHRKEIIEENFSYFGENDSWSIVLYIETTEIFDSSGERLDYDSLTNREFIATYKNSYDALTDIENLLISYDIGHSETVMTYDFSDYPPQEVEFRHISTGNGTVFRNNNDLEVTIIVNGVSETIQLKKQ